MLKNKSDDDLSLLTFVVFLYLVYFGGLVFWLSDHLNWNRENSDEFKIALVVIAFFHVLALFIYGLNRILKFIRNYEKEHDRSIKINWCTVAIVAVVIGYFVGKGKVW